VFFVSPPNSISLDPHPKNFLTPPSIFAFLWGPPYPVFFFFADVPCFFPSPVSPQHELSLDSHPPPLLFHGNFLTSPSFLRTPTIFSHSARTFPPTKFFFSSKHLRTFVLETCPTLPLRPHSWHPLFSLPISLQDPLPTFDPLDPP